MATAGWRDAQKMVGVEGRARAGDREEGVEVVGVAEVEDGAFGAVAPGRRRHEVSGRGTILAGRGVEGAHSSLPVEGNAPPS